jgi:hypothetical protein
VHVRRPYHASRQKMQIRGAGGLLDSGMGLAVSTLADPTRK